MAKKFHSMGELVGLEGMPPRVRGWSADTITEAMRVVAAKGVATSAGEYGSVTVWKSGDGIIHADFQQYRVTVAKGNFDTFRMLREWMKIWWPRMSEPQITRKPRKSHRAKVAGSGRK